MNTQETINQETERLCFICERELEKGENGTQYGYYCCDEYFCDDRCLNKSFLNSGETWEQHYSEDGACYWTEWEAEA